MRRQIKKTEILKRCIPMPVAVKTTGFICLMLVLFILILVHTHYIIDIKLNAIIIEYCT